MAPGRKRPPAPVWLSALVAGTLAAALLLGVAQWAGTPARRVSPAPADTGAETGEGETP